MVVQTTLEHSALFGTKCDFFLGHITKNQTTNIRIQCRTGKLIPTKRGHFTFNCLASFVNKHLLTNRIFFKFIYTISLASLDRSTTIYNRSTTGLLCIGVWINRYGDSTYNC